jgi:hypothetical protein
MELNSRSEDDYDPYFVIGHDDIDDEKENLE